MSTPIYDRLVAELGFSPEPVGANPLASLLPVTAAANPTMALPAVRPGFVAEAFGPSDDLGLVDVPPRVDDWCEDRPPEELA